MGKQLTLKRNHPLSKTMHHILIKHLILTLLYTVQFLVMD